ncbi:hypothetical protein NB640_01420 [Oxalobacter vibrioformis]|uniref:Uncharacterized protein n=1 Tax=Oxalobacter vibrioformis TaxID=933080 RepID=A0A9E9M012_9BURK|nr:hypothetical protein [Oxalobacter vibrioformis]WAW10353.1 hypothetical protein NB640_01420 [Oxalobacter vibrioformis]
MPANAVVFRRGFEGRQVDLHPGFSMLAWMRNIDSKEKMKQTHFKGFDWETEKRQQWLIRVAEERDQQENLQERVALFHGRLLRLKSWIWQATRKTLYFMAGLCQKRHL